MSTHAHAPGNSYLCHNTKCRLTSSKPGKCRACGSNKFLNPKPQTVPRTDRKAKHA